MRLTPSMKQLIDYDVCSALKSYTNNYFSALYKDVKCSIARHNIRTARYRLFTFDNIKQPTTLREKSNALFLNLETDNIICHASRHFTQMVLPELYIKTFHSSKDIDTIIKKSYLYVKNIYEDFFHKIIINGTFNNKDIVKFYKITNDPILDSIVIKKYVSISMNDTCKKRYADIYDRIYSMQPYISLTFKYKISKTEKAEINTIIFPFLKKVCVILSSYKPSIKNDGKARLRMFSMPFNNEKDVSNVTITLVRLVLKRICNNTKHVGLLNQIKNNAIIGNNIIVGNITRNLAANIYESEEDVHYAFTILNDRRKSFKWVNNINVFKQLLVSIPNKLSMVDFNNNVNVPILHLMRLYRIDIKSNKYALINNIKNMLSEKESFKRLRTFLLNKEIYNEFLKMYENKIIDMAYKYIDSMHFGNTIKMDSFMPIIKVSRVLCNSTKNTAIIDIFIMCKYMDEYETGFFRNLLLKVSYDDPFNYKFEVLNNHKCYIHIYNALGCKKFCDFKSFCAIQKDFANMFIEYITHNKLKIFNKLMYNFSKDYIDVINETSNGKLAHTIDNLKLEYKKIMEKINKHRMIEESNNIRMGNSYDLESFIIQANYYLESKIELIQLK